MNTTKKGRNEGKTSKTERMEMIKNSERKWKKGRNK